MNSIQFSVDAREDALRMIKEASVAGLISAGITMLIVGIGVVSDVRILGFGAWNVIDVVLIAGFTYSIYYHQSRTGAILLFGYHLLNQAVLRLNSGSGSGAALALIFAFYYFQGIRGTIAYHRMEGENEQDRDVTGESDVVEQVEHDTA
jgi:serine/threonine-protein kinase